MVTSLTRQQLVSLPTWVFQRPRVVATEVTAPLQTTLGTIHETPCGGYRGYHTSLDHVRYHTLHLLYHRPRVLPQVHPSSHTNHVWYHTLTHPLPQNMCSTTHSPVLSHRPCVLPHIHSSFPTEYILYHTLTPSLTQNTCSTTHTYASSPTDHVFYHTYTCPRPKTMNYTTLPPVLSCRPHTYPFLCYIWLPATSSSSNAPGRCTSHTQRHIPLYYPSKTKEYVE